MIYDNRSIKSCNEYNVLSFNGYNTATLKEKNEKVVVYSKHLYFAYEHASQY